MQKKVKITKEVVEMYKIFKDVGELSSYKGMTGDFEKDIESFAAQYNEIATIAKKDYRNE